MDFSKIKNLVKQNGDKFIMIENGEPEIVMMSFREYEKLTGVETNPSTSLRIRQEVKQSLESQDYQEEFADLDPRGLRETELIAPVEPSSIPALTESIGLPVRLEDIRLEDLPI